MAKKPKNRGVNPFDFHVNKSKYNVVGKQFKGTKGKPAKSKSLAIKKREETLLKEYKLKHKVNKVIDRRLGDQNRILLREEKKKKNIFNLNDEEILTHRGEPLSKANLADQSDFSDEDDGDRLDADFVDTEHFGGGAIYKNTQFKTKKEKLMETIAESKFQRYESKKQQEEHKKEVESLNSELMSLIPKIAEIKKGPKEENVKKDLEYNALLMSIAGDTSKSAPSNRLKTQEEIASERKKYLDYEESQRQARMDSEEEDNCSEPAKRQIETIKPPKAPPLEIISEIPEDFCPVEVPENFNSFCESVTNETPEKIDSEIKKFIQSSHPSTTGGSREKCEKLFDHLFKALFSYKKQEQSTSKQDIYDGVFIKYMVILNKVVKDYITTVISQSLEERYNAFCTKHEAVNKDLLLFFKLCGELYPKSDRKHFILTPTCRFMSKILLEYSPKSEEDFSVYENLLKLYLEFFVSPIRFDPNILKAINLLVGSCVCEKKDDSIVNRFKNVLNVIEIVIKIWDSLPGIKFIGNMLLQTVGKAPLNVFPKSVSEDYKKLCADMNGLKNPDIGLPKPKPKYIKLLMPYIPDKNEIAKAGKVENRKQLRGKVTNENRSVKKELKKDRESLAKVQLQDTLESDKERRRKVGRIMGELAGQESTYQKHQKVKNFREK